jgi:hypothetical protein
MAKNQLEETSREYKVERNVKENLQTRSKNTSGDQPKRPISLLRIPQRIFHEK